MPLPAGLSPIAPPHFRLLWLGPCTSSAGDALVPVALAFATLSIARSASALGLVLATSTLARVISLPIGGVWADRLPRQRVMLASDVIRGLVQAAIAALLMTHTAHLWHLVLGGVVFNFAGGFFQPASTALTPQTVDAQELQQANALMGLTRSTVWLVGPAVSGVLVATVGPAVSFAIDAATFAASATSLAFLNTRQITGIERKNFWRELEDGIRDVAARRWSLLKLGAHAVWNFAFAAFLVAAPIVAPAQLGRASAWVFIGNSMDAGYLLG